jgi:hypothetical protein
LANNATVTTAAAGVADVFSEPTKLAECAGGSAENG